MPGLGTDRRIRFISARCRAISVSWKIIAFPFLLGADFGIVPLGRALKYNLSSKVDLFTIFLSCVLSNFRPFEDDIIEEKTMSTIYNMARFDRVICGFFKKGIERERPERKKEREREME